MLHYAHAFFNQVAQSAACNQFHSIRQRCCRWLLMTHDRMQSDEFLLTQEFLAMMLGVQRTGVTAAAGVCNGPALSVTHAATLPSSIAAAWIGSRANVTAFPRWSSTGCSAAEHYARFDPAESKAVWLMGWTACHLANTQLERLVGEWTGPARACIRYACHCLGIVCRCRNCFGHHLTRQRDSFGWVEHTQRCASHYFRS